AADVYDAFAGRPARYSSSSCRGGRRRLSIHAPAALARRSFYENHGRRSRIVMALWIIAGMTFREAARKKILWTALIAGLGFLAVFGIGLHYQMADFSAGSMPAFLRYQILSGMLMIGLYTVDLLAVVMTILTSVDTISGEITSGTIHAIATKPLARSQILIGKWLGFVAMAGVYVFIMFWGAIAEGYWIGGVMAQHPVRGSLLVFLECIVALSVTFMFGTWFSTLTSGVITLRLLGVAFLGGWLEQMSGFTEGS